MNKINIILITVFFVGCNGCKKVDDVSGSLDSFTISYQINSSWINYTYHATIDQNGNLEVSEKNEISDQSRESEFVISDEELRLIKERLNNLVSIRLSERYGFDNVNAPTDLPVRKIKYTTINKSDSAYLHFITDNELPDELALLLQVVEQTLSANDTIKNQ